MWFDPVVVTETICAEITFSPVHTCAIGAVRKESGLDIRFPRFAETIGWTSQVEKVSGQIKQNNEMLKCYLHPTA